MATIKSIISGFLGLKKDPNATTQDVAVIKAEDTNAGIVLKPNGTGAIMAQVPDGTATGGNARGDYAVDLHWLRVGTLATAVASGNYSVLIGGQRNTASGNFSIAMGNTNTASGPSSKAIGGTANTASSDHSVVSGGQSNTASTNSHATVVGGQSNTASGQHSISGVFNAVSSGNKSVALGQQAIASGSNAVALGGDAGGGSGSTASGTRSFAVSYGSSATNQGSLAMGNEASSNGIFSVALGYRAASRYYGKYAYANGSNGQYAYAIAKRSSVVLNASDLAGLFIDNSAVQYQFLNGVDVTMSFTIDWVATVTAVGSGSLSFGDAICGKDFFLLKSIAQNNSIGTITRISTSTDASMSTSTMTYSVNSGSVNGYLSLKFNAPTTANNTTFKIVANIQTIEIGTN